MALNIPVPLVCIHEHQVLRWAGQGPRRFPLHYIILILRGRGRYRNAGHDLPLDRPVISFIPAGDEDLNQIDGLIESWFVGFRWPGATIGATNADGGDLRLAWGDGQMVVPRVFQPEAADVATLCAMYAALSASQAVPSAGLGARGQVLSLIDLYAAAATRSHGGQPEVQLRDLIEDPANDAVRLEDLLARCGLSGDRLRARFRARYGMSPVGWRLSRRLDRARDLLSRPGATVAAAAAAAGFDDPGYFARRFHRQFGIVPRALLRRGSEKT